MQILKELEKLRPEFLTSRMIRSKGKWWWSWLPMEPMSVTPRSLLWISETSVEPAPQYQRLQEQSVAVPLWSALCPRVSLQWQPGTTASPSHSPSRSHKHTSQLAKSIQWKRSGTRSPRFFPWDTEQRRQVWQCQVNNSLPATFCSAVQFSETVYLHPTWD